MESVFVTGGTGYIGRPLIGELLARGHVVLALARRGSEQRLPGGATPVLGDALDAGSFAHAVPPGATIVHLVGTPHPNPAKAAEFERVDLASARAMTQAAIRAAARHIVYVSVAQPAPIMRAYIEARRAGEAFVRETGLPATILRPWYVLGPGQWWPYALVPLYAALALIPATRAGARRLGLVTRAEMVGALVGAIESPPLGVRVVDVPGIRSRILQPPVASESDARATARTGSTG